ncbi:hypothetical protein M9458_015490, partial [Cirrhinus mrigala]
LSLGPRVSRAKSGMLHPTRGTTEGHYGPDTSNASPCGQPSRLPQTQSTPLQFGRTSRLA